MFLSIDLPQYEFLPHLGRLSWRPFFVERERGVARQLVNQGLATITAEKVRRGGKLV
jgi:hypothetical protein